MRSQEAILAELDDLAEQDSNDHEIDRLREIVHEMLDDHRRWPEGGEADADEADAKFLRKFGNEDE